MSSANLPRIERATSDLCQVSPLTFKVSFMSQPESSVNFRRFSAEILIYNLPLYKIYLSPIDSIILLILSIV